MTWFRRLICGLAIAAACFGQCSITSTASCPCDASQAPCVQLYLQQVYTAYSAINSANATRPQPLVELGGQIVPAVPTYWAGDNPACLAPPNTCTFMNPGHINAYMDGMATQGIKTQDASIDPTPFCVAAEYSGGCVPGSNLAILTAKLAVLDAMFDHAKATNVKLRISPTPNAVTWSVCSLNGATMTVGQMAGCLDPMYVGMIAHEIARGNTGVIVAVTGGREVTGIWAIETGQTFSTADWAIFAGDFYSAITTAYPSMTVAAGFLTTEITYLTAIIALGLHPLQISFDVYGSQLVSQYPAIVASVRTLCAQAAAGSENCVVAEAAPPRQVPSTGSCGGGENCAYNGCGYPTWVSSGATAMWLGSFIGAMRAVPNMVHIAWFPNGPSFGTNATLTNCQSNTVPGSYYAELMPVSAQTSLAATVKALVTGAPLVISGNLTLTGKVQ